MYSLCCGWLSSSLAVVLAQAGAVAVVQAGVVLILIARLVRPALPALVGVAVTLVAHLRIAARLARPVHLRTAAPWVAVTLVEAALLATGDIQWHR